MMKNEFENGKVLVAALFAVCLALAAIPQGLQAQEVVLTACYVPNVGVVYRIKADGLPEACTEETHVEFSWNMEGPAGPEGVGGPEGPEGPAGPEGPSGIAPVVFAGACTDDAFSHPNGSGLTRGLVINDARFMISDPPALSIWEGETATPGFLRIQDGWGSYWLEDGRMLLTCFPDSIVVIVSFPA